MRASWVKSRNALEAAIYRSIAKPIFFSMDPEFVHDRISWFGKILGATAPTRAINRFLFNFEDTRLSQKITGLSFVNPVGLAAGFDKEGNLIDTMSSVGFGFMEVGSVTAKAYAGNAYPRLSRLPKSKALIVNYGLKSEGAVAVAHRIATKKFVFPVGISIAPTNDASTMDEAVAIEDCYESYGHLAPLASYITLNISCPNTEADQPFKAAERLDKFIARIREHPVKKPLFLKLSPDLSTGELDGIIEVALKQKIDGLIMGNLTKNRALAGSRIVETDVPAAGGISGKVVEPLADALLKHAYQKTRGRIVLIGCGGVFTAEDAYKKIRLGANLIQLATGMIFQGPQTASSINLGLTELLERDGLKNITEAVGLDNH